MVISFYISAKNSTCKLDWFRDIWQNRLRRLSPIKIDWLIDLFVVVCFTPHRQYFSHITVLKIKRNNRLWNYKIFGWPSRPHSPSKSREAIFLACQWGCYLQHGAPFNVPSNGHIATWTRCKTTVVKCQ